MINQDLKRKIKIFLDLFLAIIALIALVAFIASTGFYLEYSTIRTLSLIIKIITVCFIVQELARWFIVSQLFKYLKQRIIENVIAGLLLLNFIFPDFVLDLLKMFGPELDITQLTILYLAIFESAILIALMTKAVRYNYLLSKVKLSPALIIVISFAILILLGSLMLSLPKASPFGNQISYVNALFTSTSAVCVTGLTSVDTAKDFSDFGRMCILLLIQLGGLGIMTLTTFFAAYFAGGMSFKVRLLMKDILSEENLDEVKGLLLKIAAYTIIIELSGAVLLYFAIGGTISHLDPNKSWIAVFHAVSAFCNAGFSTFSANLYDPMLRNNYFFNTVIMSLIVIGGAGFVVISNIWLRIIQIATRKINPRGLTIHSRIVIITTLLLILGGALIIYLTDSFYGNSFNHADKAFHSVFLSVTTRTAGFNTVDIGALAPASVMVCILLMWIGASPGSTGGGIKTTTLAISFMMLINMARGKSKVELFGRQINQETINRAFMVLISSVIILAIASIILVIIEPDKQPLDLVFECTSALGTVGLSRNLTFFLGDGGKVLIILLMFIGRIGTFSFMIAFFKPAKELRYSLPNENVNVG